MVHATVCGLRPDGFDALIDTIGSVDQLLQSSILIPIHDCDARANPAGA